MSERPALPPQRPCLHVLIPHEELQFSRLGYDATLMAYGINPYLPYRRIHRPGCAVVEFVQLPFGDRVDE